MLSSYDRLSPDDSMLPAMPAGWAGLRPEDYVEGAGYAALCSTPEILSASTLTYGADHTVGDWLLRSPDRIVTIERTEPRLLAAREAAKLDWANSQAGDWDDAWMKSTGADLVLVRGQIEDQGSDILLMDNGGVLQLMTPLDHLLPGPVWAVVRFQVLGNSALDLQADAVLVLRDEGPLSVPAYDESLSMSLGRATVVRWLLSRVDLSEQPLDDPSGALAALRRWHSHGLSTGVASGPFDSADRRPFRDKFQALMRSIEARPSSAPPNARLIKTAWDAEQYAAEVMRTCGYGDARVTGGGADAGIDVESSLAVAQVEAEVLPTGRPAVQALYGVACAESKSGVFFAQAGYSAQALEFATKVGMACFEFERDGTISPSTPAAEQLLRQATSAVGGS